LRVAFRKVRRWVVSNGFDLREEPRAASAAHRYIHRKAHRRSGQTASSRWGADHAAASFTSGYARTTDFPFPPEQRTNTTATVGRLCGPLGGLRIRYWQYRSESFGEYRPDRISCCPKSFPLLDPDVNGRARILTATKNPASLALTGFHETFRTFSNFVGCIFGGAEEDRTPDLRIANATLSQLSYRPTANR
jgi:hypothetical protein